jgi:hypothetical protein
MLCRASSNRLHVGAWNLARNQCAAGKVRWIAVCGWTFWPPAKDKRLRLTGYAYGLTHGDLAAPQVVTLPQ